MPNGSGQLYSDHQSPMNSNGLDIAYRMCFIDCMPLLDLPESIFPIRLYLCTNSKYCN